jgi:hypothetical protein
LSGDAIERCFQEIAFGAWLLAFGQPRRRFETYVTAFFRALDKLKDMPIPIEAKTHQLRDTPLPNCHRGIEVTVEEGVETCPAVHTLAQKWMPIILEERCTGGRDRGARLSGYLRKRGALYFGVPGRRHPHGLAGLLREQRCWKMAKCSHRPSGYFLSGIVAKRFAVDIFQCSSITSYCPLSRPAG